VGRIRPPDLVQVGVQVRIGLGRGHQPPPVVLVDRHLLGQQEPRAQPGRLGAEGEHRRDAPGVADPARRDHRHRRHRVDHGGHQRQGPDGAPHVPAGLQSLRDDNVRPGRDRPPGLLGVADRVQDNSAGVVHALDVGAWISPEKRDDPQAGLEGLVKATVPVLGEDKVAAERPRGECRCVAHGRSDVRRPGQRNHAERAGIGDRRGQPGNLSDRRLDDRLVNPKQLAYRRAHRVSLLRIFAGHRVTRLVPRQSPLCHVYEVGTDAGDFRSHPWNLE
jgi:hypothetical protein